MKQIALTTLLCACTSIYGFAQNTKQYQEYFEQALQTGNTTCKLQKSIAHKKVEQTQQQVWNAWKTANNKVKQNVLMPTAALSNHSDAWQLPDSLEPHATMPYYFGTKGNRPENGYPFFLYLHGSGPKQHEWATGLALAQQFADAPSAYFIPQIPNENEWYRWWQRSKQYAWMNLIRQLMLRPEINPNRLYVFGISEGGYGSQRLASFYADYWAAAGPMAGGEPLKNAPVENLGNIGFSLRTGANDRGFYRNLLTRYTAEALDSIEHLNPEGYRHKVELIPGKQHFIDYSVTTPWLSLFTRNPYPKQFRWEDFEMDGVHRTGFYNLAVDKRPCDSLRTRYDVNITNNNVYISIEDIHYTTLERDPMFGIELKSGRSYTTAHGGELTVFFNEKLVDPKRPVKIEVNGKMVYNKPLRANVQNMLRSVATFADSERVYPYAVTLKY